MTTSSDTYVSHDSHDQSGPGPRSSDSAPDALLLEKVRDLAGLLVGTIEEVIEGKSEVVRTAVTVLFAGGHLLVEDVPGVGKTMLAKTMARCIDATVRRIQFTPDLLPSDVTGVSIFNQDSRQFEFRRGAIFANIVVGDEINRASPKTQSALLESMEEEQVTVDGVTHGLPRPFMVMATQNPIEMEGTYPLPEAQRDRFMARISMGYPANRSELQMLEHHGAHNPLDSVTAVAHRDDVARAVRTVAKVYASPAIMQYIVDIATATRSTPALRLGASPRAALHLLRASRAHAALDGRDHVLPDDVQRLVRAVLAHRLMPSSETLLERRTTTDVLTDILRQVAVPASAR